MQVELPRLLSVLAHELRTPLSVLQGYIRLLQRQRDEGHPETPMLKAMLDATGRITAIGRQASELSSWLDPAAEAVPRALGAEALVEEMRKRATGERVTIDSEPGRLSGVRVVSSDGGMLATALVALAESLSRDLGNGRVRMSLTDAGDRVRVHLGPVDPPLPEQLELAPAAGSAVPFDRGGLGLTLVLASFVLEAHGARVSSGGAFRMDVQLKKD